MYCAIPQCIALSQSVVPSQGIGLSKRRKSVTPVKLAVVPKGRDAAAIADAKPFRNINVSIGAGQRRGLVTVGRSTNSFSLIPVLPPQPVKFPRGKLNQRFAVLLLRSTYQAVDSVDFIAMDNFQIRFWKLRQSEYEPYVLSYSPLKPRQGDLTDPLYFDFISFAQYLTVSKQIPKGEQVFTEQVNAEGEKRTVRRDPALRDNSRLPDVIAERVGDMIYDGLVNGFEEMTFGGPLPCRGGEDVEDRACILAGVRRIVQIFADKGYCLKGLVTEESGSSRGIQFKVSIEAPATLWCAQALASRNASLDGDFLGMTLSAFLRRSGYTAKYTSRVSDLFIEHTWTLS